MSNFLVTAMDVDQETLSKSKPSRGRIEKKRAKSSRKASIVFPKFKRGTGAGRSKAKK
jgi:hypothetical protein